VGLRVHKPRQRLEVKASKLSASPSEA